MEPPKTNVTPNSSEPLAKVAGGKEAEVSAELLEKSRQNNDTVLQELKTRLEGLSQSEADSRLKKYGPNEIAQEKRQSWLMRLLGNFKNPLVILLLGVMLVCYVTLTQVVKTWFIRRFGD